MVKFLSNRFIITIVIITIGVAVGFLQVEKGVSTYVEGFNKSEQRALELVANNLSSDLKPVIPILKLLARQTEAITTKDSIDRKSVLSQEFISVISGIDKFDQIRFIDINGQETVRVNYNHGNPTIVPNSELQWKGKRDYFVKTLQLNKGQIYISPMDLNIEHDQVEIPYKPTIRFCLPVFDDSGEKIGIVVVNYLASKLIGYLNQATSLISHDFFLLDQNGYWLSSPVSENEWGAVLNDRKEISMANTNPVVWDQISKSNSGSFSSGDKLYTFNTINLLDALDSASLNIKLKPDMTARYWKVVSYVPVASIYMVVIKNHSITLSWLFAATTSFVILYFLIIREVRRRSIAEDEKVIFTKAIEYAGEAVVITDPKGIITYVNPAFTKVTGYSSEEAIGNNPSMLKSSAQDPSFYKELWETITSGKTWNGTLVDKKKDGSFYPALMSVAPIFNSQGETTHYISTQQDMSDYKSLEEQLVQSQKMEALGTLVGGVAHDFNNMLAGILATAFMTKINVDNKEEVISNMESIEQMGFRASEMVNQLLIFARKGTVQLKTFDLGLFVREAYKLSSKSIPENIKLILDVSEKKMLVKGDATQLQQIIMNLLNNARDAVAGNPDPMIKFEISPFIADDAFREKHPHIDKDKWASIKVSDNGYGIPSNKLDKIFDPFFTTKAVGKGTGLGLSMVYGSVERHGGLIEVDSLQGKGTTFTIYLPREEESPKNIDNSDSKIIHGNQETILFVEDDEEARKALSETLRCIGYKVLLAENGVDGLTYFRSNKNEIALVISDLIMPKMDGMTFAGKIHKYDNNVPVIITTAYDKDQVLMEGSAPNIRALITKPFTVEEISLNIYQALN